MANFSDFSVKPSIGSKKSPIPKFIIDTHECSLYRFTESKFLPHYYIGH